MLRRRRLPGNEQGRWIGNRLVHTTHMGHDEPDYDAKNPSLRSPQQVVEKEYLTDAEGLDRMLRAWHQWNAEMKDPLFR